LKLLTILFNLLIIFSKGEPATTSLLYKSESIQIDELKGF